MISPLASRSFCFETMMRWLVTAATSQSSCNFQAQLLRDDD